MCVLWRWLQVVLLLSVVVVPLSGEARLGVPPLDVLGRGFVEDGVGRLEVRHVLRPGGERPCEVVLFSVCLEQHHLGLDDEALDAIRVDAQHDLFRGMTRLECGGVIIESHDNTSERHAASAQRHRLFSAVQKAPEETCASSLHVQFSSVLVVSPDAPAPTSWEECMLVFVPVEENPAAHERSVHPTVGPFSFRQHRGRGHWSVWHSHTVEQALALLAGDDTYQDVDYEALAEELVGFVELDETLQKPADEEFDQHDTTMWSHWLKKHPEAVHKQRERIDTPEDVQILLQTTSQLMTVTSSQLGSRMIYELVIRPIITIAKKLVAMAVQKMAAMIMVSAVVVLIGELVCAFAQSPVAAEGPNTQGPGIRDPREDWGDEAFVQLGANEHERVVTGVRAKTQLYSAMRDKLASLDKEQALVAVETTLQTAMRHRSRVRFVTQPLLDLIEPKLVDQISQAVTEQASMQLELGLAQELTNTLRTQVNLTVARRVTQELTTRLTEELSHSVVEITSHILLKDLGELTTKDITKVLVPELTYSLTHTISYAFTRHPIYDYYCYFCKHRNLYCADCKSALLDDYYRGFYNTFYAHYFESYYSYYYTEYFAKIFSSRMKSPILWSGTAERIEPISHCLDPADEACRNARLVPQQDAVTKLVTVEPSGEGGEGGV